ncbi:MAG: hypothetical protein A2V79_09280 [Betaproteobacteria bacterium RBG_16_56_24]|nr:MAG: hypothetical protein A2V79_09280 [Betaproteobacteria bacterium RBG_16_56_24]
MTKKPTNIPMVGVKSSQIVSVGYNSSTKTLAVKFTSGGTYHYHGVEQGTVDALMKADSFGKHLQANIVGKFKHKRL